MATKSARELIQERAKQRLSGNYTGRQGYLLLPEGAGRFRPEADKEYALDFCQYIVKTSNHLDRVPKGTPWLRLPFFRHDGIGSGRAQFICPRTYGGNCFLCQERQRLFDEEAEKKYTDNLRASFRELYILITEDDEFEVMEMAYNNFGKKLDRKINRLNDLRTGFFEHSASEGGHTLICDFAEERMDKDTVYPVLDSIEFEPRDDLPINPEDVPNLEDMIEVATNVQMKAAYYDLEEEEVSELEEEPQETEEDDEKEEKPRARGRGKRGKDQEEVEDDEGEQEEPVRRGRSRAKKKEEDEEEEKKPSRGRSRGRSKKKEEDEESSEQKEVKSSKFSRKGKKEEDEEEEEGEEQAELTDAAKDADSDELCNACSGKGKASNGDKCKPCRGTGVRRDQCPEGLTFGKSVEEGYEVCEDCLHWRECKEAADTAKLENEGSDTEEEEEPEEKGKSQRKKRAGESSTRRRRRRK